MIIDRVFRMGSTAWPPDPLWEGEATDIASTFGGVIRYLITEEFIEEPGYFCIVRLSLPSLVELTYWCTVTEGMMIIEGIHPSDAPSQSRLVTFWPPK